MKKLIIYSLILLCSCETALEVDLPETTPKLVINSILLSESQPSFYRPTVMISNSISGLGGLDEYIWTDDRPVINYATASITEINSGNTHELMFDTDCY